MIIERFINRKTEELKRDKEALLNILREAGAKVRGNSITCPLCDDRHPSAGIYSVVGGDDYRFKCHKCGFNGSIIDVIARLDSISTDEVFRRLRGGIQPKKPLKVYATIEELKGAMPNPVEDIYQYTNPVTNKIEMLVLRLKTPDGKSFRQAKPVNGGFVQQAPDKPWPIYNRARVQKAGTVVVVEGEKKVHILHDYGIVGTTSPAGAGKAEYADWTLLAGRNVILWADNDEPGRGHIQQVESILQSLEPAPRISILEPADIDLSHKEDVADYIEQLKALGKDKSGIQAAILDFLNTAKPRGIAAGVCEIIEDTIAGRREAVKWPWSCIGGLTKALLPGTITIICGNVGASKSFMLLESAAYWYGNGIKAAIYQLEESRDFHLLRSLAQKSCTAAVTDPDWIKENPEQIRKLYAENTAFLEGFGACIYASPDTQQTLEQLEKWARERAKAGSRIIAVDPITVAAHKSRNIWEEDSSFLHNIQRTAEKYQSSVVLVTHPVKALTFPDVTQLAGGAAYQRFAQTVLWLESHAEKTSQVKTSCGTTEIEHNRTLHLLKVRNGKGQGVKLAFNFNSDSLILQEEGIIIRKSKVGA